MTPDREQHLADNLMAALNLMSSKYREGQKEHGGNMWQKSGMLHNAEQEVADLNHYLPTLRRQLQEVLTLIDSKRFDEARELLFNILSLTCG